MENNKLLIAAAGSGKTSLLVKKAREVREENVLIVTYTEANKDEIKRKFGGSIPRNITVKTWFSFLLKHGVRPYQSALNESLHEEKIGFFLTGEKSAKRLDSKGKPVLTTDVRTGKKRPSFWGKKDFIHYYFNRSMGIYSDKVSDFIVECNKKVRGELIRRIARIFSHIFIDEVQDLAGWELEIVKLLFKSSARVLLVGDPRQVTYLTHHSSKYKKYRDGKIGEFIKVECNSKSSLCEIDDASLRASHRNNARICEFSSALYPEYPACEPCKCDLCRREMTSHEGVFLVKCSDVEAYCKKFSPQKLRYRQAQFPELNYGFSKGLGFERVIIYPTKNILSYLKTGDVAKIRGVKAKFYVALTRARRSVAIVCDYDDDLDYIDGLIKYRF